MHESGRTILTKSAAVMVFRIAQIGLGALVAIVLARYLGPTEYGKYVFIFTIVVVLSVPTQAGLSELIVRETAKGLASERPEQIYRLWKWSAVATLQLTAVTVGILVVIFLILLSLGKVESLYLLVPAVLLLLLLSIQNGIVASLRGVGRVLQSQFIEGVLRNLVFLAAIGICFWFFNGLQITSGTTFILQAASMLVLILVMGPIILRRTFRHVWSADYTSKKKEWLRAMIPFTLIGGVNIINQSTDIIMLGFLAPPSEVAVYRVGAVLAGFVSLGLGAVHTVIAPKIAKLYAQNDSEEIRRLGVRSAQFASLAAAIILPIYFVFGKNLIGLAFGPEYADAYLTLAILSAAHTFNAVMGLNSTLLSMTNNEGTVLKILSFAAIGNIALNALLISQFGSPGAAVATAITIIVWNTQMNLRCRKIFGFVPTAFSRTTSKP